MNFSEKKIRAMLIMEVLGRPPEHIVETLEILIKQIGEEKGTKVLNKKINSPVLLKDQKDFYTSFAEIEVELDDILTIVILMFKYMPANIEIISPENISIPNAGWNDILNEITRRLHGYDEIARVMQIEKNVLENKIKELLSEKRETKSKKKKN